MSACVVVLAAGEGSRFGGEGKLLASLGGRAVVAWAVDAAESSAAERVVVVVGARAAAVRVAIAPGRAEIIECLDWSSGMSASLRCGVAAAGSVEWVVVVLADGPGVTPSMIDAVLGAAVGAPAEVAAVRPMRGGRPAHPVALRRPLLGRVGELRGDAGARELLRDAVVLELDASGWPDAGDVDTPEALDALRRRFEP
jgi:CTP:molybdopterin cytidylyltransferase MocA